MPTATYGPTTTAAEIVANADLHGQRAVVTGASSGIGVETARALASTGAEVTLAVRNLEAGRKVSRTGSPQTCRPARQGCRSHRWIWPIRPRWPPSCAPGPGRCTSWSTTPV